METATVEAPVKTDLGVIRISVPLERIRAMLPLASQDASRLVLNTLLFEVQEGQVLIVATDNRRLGVSRITQDTTETYLGQFYVTVLNLQVLLKSGRIGKEENAQITFDGQHKVTLARNITTITEETNERGKYPQWRCVLPNALEAVSGQVTVDPVLLASTCQAAGETVTIKCRGTAKSPVPVEIIGKSFYGLLMPMHGIDEPSVEWIK